MEGVPTVTAPAATPSVAPARGLPAVADRSVAIDVVAVVAATACGLVGFRPVFGGTKWLLVGAVAVGGGLAVGLAGWRFRWDALTTAAVSLAAYFVLSGVIFSSQSIAGFLPTLDTLHSAAVGAVRGWADVLTTVPPIGDTGDALAVPFISTFVAAMLSISAARRTEGSVRAVAPLAALVATSILFGVAEPASLLLQGAVFAGVTVGWIAARRRGTRASAASVAGRTRAFGGVLIIGLAIVVATVVGSHLPGADSNTRFILREQADPPFDPLTYPSPLAAYRRYTDTKHESDSGLSDEVLFTVTGLPRSAQLRRIRLAVLDQYDGVVWNVAGGPNAAVDASGVFERVGESFPSSGNGPESKVQIRIRKYNDIWIPDLGDVTGIRFAGPHSAELADSLRFNRTTDTGAVPVRLRDGDVVTITAALREPPGQQELLGQAAGSAAVGTVVEAGDDVKGLAESLTAPAKDQPPIAAGYDRVRAVSDRFTSPDPAVGFAYSDGHTGQPRSEPGHSLHRMRRLAKDFADLGIAYGNGEQYASMLALISRQLGVPSRVVMGFCETGCAGDRVDVKGSDVSAWVEVNLAGSGWVALHATPDRNKKPSVQTPQPRPKPEDAAQPPPPPVTTPPAQNIDTTDARSRKKDAKSDPPLLTGTQLKLVAGVGLPVVVIGGSLLAIVELKRRRRRRRRTEGSTRQRVVGGWNELTDLALDVGSPLPRIATRREAARLLGSGHARVVADMADLATFGPEPPLEEDVTYYWDSVDASGEVLLGSLGRFARAKSKVNPTSLLANRRARRTLRRELSRRVVDEHTGPSTPAERVGV